MAYFAVRPEFRPAIISRTAHFALNQPSSFSPLDPPQSIQPQLIVLFDRQTWVGIFIVGQTKMRFLLLAVVLSFVACRPSDYDYVVYRAGRYHDDATWPVSNERAIHAKNGARLEIEKALTSATTEYRKKELRFILDRWDLYVCQVIGMKRGEKDIMLLRFFPRRMQTEYDFRDSQVQVSDGGANYWSIECDSEAAVYTSLSINGEA